MPNMTLSIPAGLHEKMKKYSEVKWSEVARKAIKKKVEDMEMLEKLTSQSKLTEADVAEISGKINKEISKKLLSCSLVSTQISISLR